jgi:iron-sulfur cluster insertion protein
MSDIFSISDKASQRIAFLINKRNDPMVKLRISVESGGCFGFQYQYNFVAEEQGEEDIYLEKNGAKVLIDKISIELIKGSVLEFQEDLSGAYFFIRNPQVTAGCGCGNSFSPKIN